MNLLKRVRKGRKTLVSERSTSSFQPAGIVHISIEAGEVYAAHPETYWFLVISFLQFGLLQSVWQDLVNFFNFLCAVRCPKHTHTQPQVMYETRFSCTQEMDSVIKFCYMMCVLSMGVNIKYANFDDDSHRRRLASSSSDTSAQWWYSMFTLSFAISRSACPLFSFFLPSTLCFIDNAELWP